MKNINTAIRLMAVHLGLARNVASGEGPVAGREEHPRTRPRLARWTAVLALAIAPVPGAASAQEDGTLTISGLFSMDYLSEPVGTDLAEIFANGHEHAWTLTLHGTSQSHSKFGGLFGDINYATEVYAASFDLAFSGPDAVALNGIVSDHIAGGAIWIYLRNSYSAFGDFAIMYVWAGGPEIEFFSGHDIGVQTLFPTDADGYPVVGPEPFSIEPDYTELVDWRSGDYGGIGSLAGLVTFEGSVGEPDPGEPVLLAVTDASIVEGDQGRSNVAVVVTLSSESSQAITVNYRTVDGTADTRRDYTGTSGTLTFQPGQTSRTISVAIKGDRKREGDETFFVQLSNAEGAIIADEVATVTILNDD